MIHEGFDETRHHSRPGCGGGGFDLHRQSGARRRQQCQPGYDRAGQGRRGGDRVLWAAVDPGSLRRGAPQISPRLSSAPAYAAVLQDPGRGAASRRRTRQGCRCRRQDRFPGRAGTAEHRGADAGARDGVRCRRRGCGSAPAGHADGGSPAAAGRAGFRANLPTRRNGARSLRRTGQLEGGPHRRVGHAAFVQSARQARHLRRQPPLSMPGNERVRGSGHTSANMRRTSACSSRCRRSSPARSHRS